MSMAYSSRSWWRITVVAVGVCCLWLGQSAFAGSIVGWGSIALDSSQLDSNDFIAIAAGGQHSLALKSDGSIVGWGSNDDGRGNFSGQAMPPAGNSFVAIAAGAFHSLALKSDGSIVAWGANWDDQATPSDGNDFVAIAAGDKHSLALKSDGSIVGWGISDGDYDDYGQVMDTPDGNDFVAIAAGGSHNLALKKDGSIVAWGSNGYSYCIFPFAGGCLWLESGQCDVPSPNAEFVAIAAGKYHSLGLKEDGSIVAWGAGTEDLGEWPNYGQATPPDGNDFVAVSAGAVHSLALKSDGSIIGWGYNRYGQATSPDGNDFVTIAAGYGHTLALKSDGSILAWGANWDGQAAPAAGNDFVAVSAGGYDSLALKADGTIVGWGAGSNAIPSDGNDFVAVATGSSHSLGLRSDGSVVAWGSNGGWFDCNESDCYIGQCDVPLPNAGFVAIAAGWYHSLGLKSDGSIVGWGAGMEILDCGQASPPSGNDFVAIAAGGSHSLALKSDGSIIGWGDDGDGQATPPDGNDYVAIAAGAYHSLALRSDGSIVGWGRNNYGQATPPGGNDFVAIAAGRWHSLALKSDGSIVGWGLDDYGQATPPAGNDFVAIAAGSSHSLAIIRKYGGGSGTPEDPYQIWTAEQMQAIGADANDWDKHFILMADIDLSQFDGKDGRERFNVIGKEAWEDRFTGVFDGNDHTISNFTDDSNDRLQVGLFGHVGGEIKNLGLISPNVNGGTEDNVGSIVGMLNAGTIFNCYAEGGSVVGQRFVGGLVGNNYGIIANCYSTGSVVGRDDVGGLVGSNDGTIANCYSTGSVAGEERVGGIAGQNGWFSCEDCWPSYGVFGAIINCYSICPVTGTRRVGGLVGYNEAGWITASFWDIQTSGMPNMCGSQDNETATGCDPNYGKTTAEMMHQSTFQDWDFNTPIWTIEEGIDYPRLWWEFVPVLHAEPEVTLGTSNTISWEPIAGEVEYYAECATDSNFTSIIYNSGWITEISFEFTDLHLGQQYWYSVKARNSAGIESQWSNVESSLQVTLADAVDIMLAPNNLKSKNLKKPYINKIKIAQDMIDSGNLTGALNKLQNDILQKTDGCAETGEPDKSDWIITCEEQSEVYPLVIETIEYVRSLME